LNQNIVSKLISFAIVVLILFSTTGCGDLKKQQKNDTASKNNESIFAETKDINETPVTDKKELYADDKDTSVVTMYLTVSKGNSADHTDHTWQEVNAHSIFYYQDNNLDRFRVDAIFQVGDETGPLAGQIGYQALTPNATVQVRGNTTSTMPQKSYKIMLKQDKGRWREQRTIILNKHIFDPLRFRNKMSYDLIKTIPGMIGARTQFVHLYVKDETQDAASNVKFEDYGLYTQVEQFNSRYLRNHNLDENGQLYKAELFEFYRYEDSLKLKTDPDYDKTAFEKVLEIKGNDDHTKLIQMVTDINNYSIPIEKSFAKYFDEDNYFTWMAFQMLTGNPDVENRNFYLYSPQNGNKWYYISWDNDAAWSTDYFNYGEYHLGYQVGISQFWVSVLHRRVLASPSYRKKLDEKVEWLYNEILTKNKISSLIEQYKKVTTPFMSKMPDLAHLRVPLAAASVVADQSNEVIDHNYKLYKESLFNPMPFYLDTPAKTDAGYHFAWETAFDFNDETITYSFELSNSYLFDNEIEKQTGLALPQADFVGNLPYGEYFYRVIATNASGKTQTAFDYCDDDDYQKHYGIYTFYVTPEGILVGDKTVEK